jgi:uncharacterized protein YcfJ
MDRSRIGAIALGMSLAIIGAAIASYALGSRHPYAQVLSVKPAHAASHPIEGRCAATAPGEASRRCGSPEFEVKYSLDGRPGVVRMQHDPGDRIPVENGRLVLDAPPLGSRLF